MSLQLGPGVTFGPGVRFDPLASIVTTGLVEYLDAGTYSGSGATWTADVGIDASLYFSPAYTAAAPTYFNFDPASGQFAQCLNLGDLSNWTVEAWFRPTADLSLASLTSVVTTVYQDGSDFFNAINFCLTNHTGVGATIVNGIQAGFYNGAWHTTSPLLTTPGTWYQVVGTYDGTDLKQYNNGEYSNTTTVGSPSSANGGPLRIARRWDGDNVSQYLFPGDIAIVRVYNTALNDTQVAQNFGATRERFGL